MTQRNNIFNLLAPSYPDLIPELKKLIERSEHEFCPARGSDSFLWEHTVYVASMAYTIACDEGVTPILPVVTALFHDCGKFRDGRYHEDEKPEEETAAEIAGVLLHRNGFAAADITLIEESLLALYNQEKRDDNIYTRIVHDADFLVKFGYMGFANFFEKSVLRGMVIRKSILKSMSKELTYAVSLEKNMQTASGRKIACKKSQITLHLFQNYLNELKEANISPYEIREMEIDCCKDPDAIIPVVMVLPESCEVCSGKLKIAFERDKGIKCEKLIVNISCCRCGGGSDYDFSFCLPEIAVHRNRFKN